MSFYIAIADDGMQDFRSACGAFRSAENAASAENLLLSVRPKEWGLKAPPELAAVGSFFILSLGQVDSLNCVIGPYDSVRSAKTGAGVMLAGGGVFEAEDDWFIAAVRFVRQTAPESAQVMVLERIWDDA